MSPDEPARQPGAPLLRATGVSKRFGAVQALADVCLTLERGSVVALAGENGSGKSTFVRILAGVAQPDTGRVEIDGAEAQFRGPREALDAGVCLVSQEPTLVPSLSIAENVLLPRLNRPGAVVRRRRLVAEAEPHLARMGLRIDPRRPVGSLAGGDRELVEVAKALATRPRILILDEVTARLPDPERLFEVVDALAADGLAVVVITHRLREIRRSCHRAVVLRDGRNVADLGPSDLGDEQLTRAMVGRDLGEFFHKVDPTPGAVALQLDGLVTSRSSDPVSLSVRSGEIVGVAGLVGSGRSELLETVAGARRPVAGAVRVDGHPLRLGAPRRSRDAGISFVPEDRFSQALVPDASVTANLALGGHRILARARSRVERRRAAAAVREYGVRCRGVDVPVRNLSGGNAQKVVLASALTSEPAVLLLDEPTRGVDVGARSDIYAVIARHVARGAAVLLASSDMLELLGLCDRIVVLAEGRVTGVLERSEATEEAIALYAHAGGHRDVA